MGFFKKLWHRHTWKPLKTVYRYKDRDGYFQISVKKCQCLGCGKIDYIHFVGKNVYYKDWRIL